MLLCNAPPSSPSPSPSPSWLLQRVTSILRSWPVRLKRFVTLRLCRFAHLVANLLLISRSVIGARACTTPDFSITTVAWTERWQLVSMFLYSGYERRARELHLEVMFSFGSPCLCCITCCCKPNCYVYWTGTYRQSAAPSALAVCCSCMWRLERAAACRPLPGPFWRPRASVDELRVLMIMRVQSTICRHTVRPTR